MDIKNLQMKQFKCVELISAENWPELCTVKGSRWEAYLDDLLLLFLHKNICCFITKTRLFKYTENFTSKT